MSEGPTRREIERVREALDRHDAELREDADAETDEPEEEPEDEEEGA
jgi:hypothetical protein